MEASRHLRSDLTDHRAVGATVLDQITPLILTFNEAPNIRRTLDRLTWAHRIVVVDSGSTDDTRDILRGYPQADVIRHDFQDFASQCNFGLTQVTSPWVLSLDADYVLSDALISELHSLPPMDNVSGYRVRFIYCIQGRPLRASLYPPRIVLYQRNRAKYIQEGHAHRVTVSGKIIHLHGIIYHDDRKPLARWLASQQRYTTENVISLLSTPRAKLTRRDKLRLMIWPAPILVFLYSLIVKRCLLDGWAGWLYALQRAVAEALLSIELIDRRLRNTGSNAERGQN